MISQRLPITFFEKFADVITKKIPAFFKKKHDVDVDYEVFTTNKKADEYNLKAGNRKKMIAELEGTQAHHTFMLEYSQKELQFLHAAGINEGKKVNAQEALNLTYLARCGITKETSNAEREEKQTQLFKTMMTVMHDFNFYGKKIFRVEEAITEELMLTDCRNIDDEFLQLPFDTICLHLPFNNTMNIRSDLAEWVFVSQKDIDDIRSDFEIFCVTKKGYYYEEKFTFTGGDIAKQIKEQIRNKFGGSKLAIEENTKLFSFITSVILYINSENVDQVTITPDRSFKEKHSAYPVCSLGRNIVINKKLYGSYNRHTEKEFHVLKWTVRGHYRHQKCGAGRYETKIIWIRPFIKGKERLVEEIEAKPAIYKL